jgi:hypothetical protein
VYLGASLAPGLKRMRMRKNNSKKKAGFTSSEALGKSRLLVLYEV